MTVFSMAVFLTLFQNIVGYKTSFDRAFGNEFTGLKDLFLSISVSKWL